MMTAKLGVTAFQSQYRSNVISLSGLRDALLVIRKGDEIFALLSLKRRNRVDFHLSKRRQRHLHRE